MRFTILFMTLFAVVAQAIPLDPATEASDVSEGEEIALTAGMQNTIDISNAVLSEAGVQEAERACSVSFRKCYMGCTGAPTCYAVCFIKFCR